MLKQQQQQNLFADNTENISFTKFLGTVDGDLELKASLHLLACTINVRAGGGSVCVCCI